MGERHELDDIASFLKEYRERMAPVWVRLEECRKVLDDLEGQVRELEDMLRRDRRRHFKGLEDALLGDRRKG